MGREQPNDQHTTGANAESADSGAWLSGSSGIRLSWIGDRFLQITLGDAISVRTQHRVHAACAQLRSASLPALRDIIPAYTTLLLAFDLNRLEPAAIEQSVRSALRTLDTADAAPSRLIELPVCYDASCGADLHDVARLHAIDVSHLIALHCAAEYTVGFIGFLPGFAYLHGLTPQLQTPRLASPRTRVPSGSVGIAGTQTGIYPSATPGGWRLIGRTPLRLFDADRAEPSLLAMGDRVRFRPIDRSEFDAILASQGAG